MRRCLLLISLMSALMWLSPCRADNSVSREYNLLMQVCGNDITAICMMDTSADDTTVGTVVNEFGVKAFDFRFSNGKAVVFNVIGPLNKWFIRRVLRRDFTFILKHIFSGKDAMEKKRSITFLPSGDIKMSNCRHKIYYTFTPTSDNQRLSSETDR